MTKVWDKPITADTDWGGDASTGGLPVSGRIVQEFIKDTLASIASAIKTDEQLKDFIKSYLDEKGITSDEGFVTLATEQIIKAVKDFEKGLKINGSPLIEYDAEKDALFLPTNLVVRGAITLFGDKGTTVPSIWASFPYDNETIKFNETTGKFYAVGGGTGGGVADSVAWANITDKPTWIGADKPSYSYSEILETPDLGGFVTAESLTELLSGKADAATTLAGYGITDAYTKDELKTEFAKYLRLSGEEQSISAIHNFTNGLLIDGLAIKKSADKTFYFDGNIVVSGAITMFGKDSTTFPTIWANIPFNKDHMSWDGSQWNVEGGGGASVTYDSVINALGYTPLSTSGGVITALGRSQLSLQSINSAGAALWLGTEFETFNAGSLFEYSYNDRLLAIVNFSAMSNDYYGVAGLFIRPDNRITVGDVNRNVEYDIIHDGNISHKINKSYIANTLGIAEWALATSLEWNAVQNRPTFLSQFTDDILTGKNILLSGCTIEAQGIADFTIYRKGSDISAIHFYNTQNGQKVDVGYLGATANRKPVYIDSGGANYDLLHSNNYSSYALPLSGGTVNGNLSVSGNVVIGGTTASEKLHVYGNILATGTITFFSQASLKNVINHEGLSLDELARIRPARFRWKDGRDDRVHVGVIAENILPILPEVVYFTGEEKTKTVDYASLATHIGVSLIKPVVNLAERVKYLEAEVKTLKEEKQQTQTINRVIVWQF